MPADLELAGGSAAPVDLCRWLHDACSGRGCKHLFSATAGSRRNDLLPSGVTPGMLCPPSPAAELPWLMFSPDLCLHGVKHLFGGGEGKGNTVFATLTSASPDACASWLGGAHPGASLLGAWDPSHPTEPHRGLQGSRVSHHHLRGRSHYLLCRCGQRCHLRATHGASSIPPCSGGCGAEPPPIIFG